MASPNFSRSKRKKPLSLRSRSGSSGPKPAPVSNSVKKVTSEVANWSPLQTEIQLSRLSLSPQATRKHEVNIESSLDVSSEGDQLVYGCGWPGLLIASLNVRTGTLSRLPVPVPSNPNALQSTDSDDLPKLADTKASCLCFVGSKQLWVGTERGTLHVFSSAREEDRTRDHKLLQLHDSVLCITTRPESQRFQSVYVGTASGRLVVFSGATDGNGGLLDPFAVQTSIDLMSGANRPYRGSAPIRSAAFADNGMLWCGVGMFIVIVNPESLKIEHEFKAEAPKEVAEGSPKVSSTAHGLRIVAHLVPSDVGMWSACWHAPAVYLWDIHNYTLKTEIVSKAYRASAGWVEASANITALAVDRSTGILLVGTRGGHILLFDILPATASITSFKPCFLYPLHHGTETIRSIQPLRDPLPELKSAYRVPRDSDKSQEAEKGQTKEVCIKVVNCADGQNGSILFLWEFRIPHDRERLQRQIMHRRLLESQKSTESFVYPKLRLVHVAPTALVKTGLS